MKILITGVTGFLGSHLAKFLIENGHSVIGLKRKSSSTSKIDLISDRLELFDIEEGLEFLSSEIDAVIHTATCYGNKGAAASEILSANVIFPLFLMEKAKARNISIFINASTFFCKADDDYGYLNNYIKSKKIFHDFGKSFGDFNGMKFINVSLEHMYGPGDADSKFITDVTKRFIGHQEVLDFTPGNQIRDFIHVDDVVFAFDRILNYAKSNFEGKYEEFEVGTGMATSIKDFVSMIHALSNSKTVMNFGALPYRSSEIMYSRANTENLIVKTGWSSRVSMAEGIHSILSDLMLKNTDINNEA